MGPPPRRGSISKAIGMRGQARWFSKRNLRLHGWIAAGMAALTAGSWALSGHVPAQSGGGTDDADGLGAEIAAMRGRLQSLSREREPLDWASAKARLGVALETQGRREEGPARLNEAVSAFHEALSELTRERFPLDWARVQINLGTTLFRLGEREGGTAHYDEAATAFREALEELTPERMPLEWAQTQESLASAYWALFVRARNPDFLGGALTAVNSALKEYRNANAAIHINEAERLRGQILGAMGKL
jgi:tetratricopeptide (TPR) repeat protein